ncbi:MAG TPA: hypothetical protein VI434_12185 [Candidatus Dormibacteraeota bacterium]
MIRRFIAGLLLVAGGAAIAVGVAQRWATVPATGQDLNGFTLGSTPVDAVVSFAVAAVLVLTGLAIILRGGAVSRSLGFLCSVLAIAWAAEIVLLLSSANHDLDHMVPAVSLVRHLELGYFLVAGGALVGFVGGLVGLTARQAQATTVAPATTPTTRSRRPMTPAPVADRVAARGAAWGPETPAGEPSSVDPRTHADVGSRR